MRPDSPTTFLLIRHAQTVWNREHRLAGSSEVPLSGSATSQIKHLTQRLIREPATAAYSSPLNRCVITLQPTVAILGIPFAIRPDLRERRLGRWEGKAPEELLPDYPGYHFPDSAYTGEFRIPGAETLEHLERRLRTVLRRLSTRHPGEVVLLSTHSGVIWTVFHRVITNPPTHLTWPGNCSITTIRTEGNHFVLHQYEKGFEQG